MTGRIAVIGGGVAGLSTAAALRSQGHDGAIHLIDAGDFPYDRPPLSKDYLAGTKDLGQLALQPAAWYDEQDITLRTRTRVTALRPGLGAVELGDGTLLTVDRVVLATGGHPVRPPLPGADGPRVHVLRTADDADRLRAALVPGARLLVVGAGLIGAEAASTALHAGCEVTLVDPVAVPLAPVLGTELAGWLHGVHRENGVDTRTTGLSALRETTGGIAADFSDGTTGTFDAVLMGVGMRPDTALAEAAGLAVDRGVLVDASRTTSHPHVLAVGDSARGHLGGVPQRRAEHWEAARHDADHAAAALLGRPAPPATAPWFWTDRHHHHVEAVGDMAAATDTLVRDRRDGHPVAVLGLRDGLVVAAASVDDPHTVRAARRMIDRGIRADPGRLADPSVGLRALLRG